jgi:hypothetical protein
MYNVSKYLDGVSHFNPTGIALSAFSLYYDKSIGITNIEKYFEEQSKSNFRSLIMAVFRSERG